MNNEQKKNEALKGWAIVGIFGSVMMAMYIIVPDSVWYGTSEWGDIIGGFLGMMAFGLAMYLVSKVL